MNKLTKYSFSDLYSISSGISSTKEQAGHGSPFVSFSTVFNNYFLPEHLTDKMMASNDEQNKFSILKGDILLTRTSETIDELAMSSVALMDYPETTFSGFLKRLRPKDKTSGIAYHKFMAFYLRSDLFRKIITNNASMTLRASFNKTIFSFLNLYLPQYKDQVKIGNLLCDIEMKIQNNIKINEVLEKKIKTLYNYWFTQFEFPDTDGNPYKSNGGKMTWNEKLKRSIPEGWDIIKFEKLAKIKSGFPFSSSLYEQNGNYKVITIKNVHNSMIVIDNTEQIKKIPSNMPEYCQLKKGDILMTLTGNVGRTALVFSENCLLNQRVGVISPVLPNISTYLYFLMKDKYITRQMLNFARGSSQANLSPTEVEEIYIPVNLKIINSFNQLVESSLRYILRNSSETYQLIKLRDWLLPFLMNGQATVSE